MSDVPFRNTIKMSWARICIAGSLGLLPIPALAGHGFSFRGIPVGATLAEVRAIPFPDHTKNVKLVCTGDALAKQKLVRLYVTPPDRLKSVGVIICRYFKKSLAWVPWSPQFANVSGYDTVLLFTPAKAPSEKRERLYLVQARFATKFFSQITDAMTARYGAPSAAATDTVQTKLGVKYKNRDRMWTLNGTTALITQFSGTITIMSVSYSDDNLAKWVADAVISLTKEDAKHL